MPNGNTLLAWIESPGEGEFVAAFTAATASKRLPATKQCASPDEAKHWIEREAAALGAAVEWTDRARTKTRP